MSIEKKIEDLIAALERNTLVLQSIHMPVPDALFEKFPEVPVREATTQPTVEPDEVETITAADEVKPELKYEDMVTAFRQYIGKNGRDKAAEILTAFGITGKLTADQLPESKYQEFLDALK